MPELPEVETTVQELKKEIVGLKIIGIWSDWKKVIKNLSLEDFEKKIHGLAIRDIERRAKMLVFYLSQDKFLLAHQKMTGHFLVGKWKFNERAKRKWEPQDKGPLEDKINDYIHLVFFLSDGRKLAFSDLRKFGWIALYENKKPDDIPEIKNLGIDPLSKNFTPEKLRTLFAKTRKVTKQALMDQNLISGIGNIYSDEILWQAKIHPKTPANGLKSQKLKTLYQAIKDVLEKAVKFKGTTIASRAEEYRRPRGERGGYQERRYVYRRTGEPCFRCKTKIERIKIGQRSTHFCPQCQKALHKRKSPVENL